jgi:hypothetical protein
MMKSVVYQLVERGVDYSSTDKPLSLHKTIDGAVNAIPEKYRKPEQETPLTTLNKKYRIVKSFLYYYVEEKDLLD